MAVFEGNLRARDVERYLLLEADIHPKVKTMLKELAERQYAIQKQVAECVTLLNNVVVIAEAFNMTAEGMKKKLDALDRNQEGLEK